MNSMRTCYREQKYFDSYVSARPIAESTDWLATELDPTTLNTLCVPAQGPNLNEYIGRSIAVDKISINATVRTAVESNLADILPVPYIRLILYVDTQTNGVQSQGEDVMEAPGAATQALAVTTFQKFANQERYVLLHDNIYQFGELQAMTDGTNTSSQCLPDIPLSITIEFEEPMIISFNNVHGGTIADIVDNSLHLIGQKSHATFTHVLSYSCRTYYEDY